MKEIKMAKKALPIAAAPKTTKAVAVGTAFNTKTLKQVNTVIAFQPKVIANLGAVITTLNNSGVKTKKFAKVLNRFETAFTDLNAIVANINN
jgi:hypothetical protein